jgi:hypothetical protein
MSHTTSLASPGAKLTAELSWRSIGIASTAYVAAAAFSYVDPRLAIGLCIVVFAETARRDPDLSLYLLVFALPFDRIFHLREADGIILLAAQLALQLVALVHHRRPDPFALLHRDYWTHDLRQTAWPLLGAYALLAVMYVNSGVDWRFHLKAAAFAGAVLLLVMIYDGRMERRTRTAVILAVIVGALFQIAFDTAFLQGAGALLLPPETLPFDPVINGRLMGLTISSNDLAESLVCAFCLAGAGLILGQRDARAARIVLVAVLYAGVAMTISKGAFLATGVVLAGAMLAFLLMARWDLVLRTGALAGLCAALLAAVIVIPAVGPRVMASVEAAIRGRDVPAQAGIGAPARQPRPMPSLGEAIEYRLRVGVATRQQSDPDRQNVVRTGTITCELACSGHRDELWKAGLDVVRQHWLLGVGFGGWRFEMHSRLGFGYTSPHNATLHLWGMFGLLGLALNLGLYGLVLRRAYGLRSLLAGGSRDAACAVGSTSFIFIVMVHEAIETSMILSLSRFGLFAWLMLAVQSSAIRDAGGSDQTVNP